MRSKGPGDEETDVEERAHDRRGCEQTRACRPQKLIQRDAGARPRQIDGPYVMKRHTSKKVVNPQWQPFELLCRDLGHRASLAVRECYRDVTSTTSQLSRGPTTARATRRAYTRQFPGRPWYQRGQPRRRCTAPC